MKDYAIGAVITALFIGAAVFACAFSASLWEAGGGWKSDPDKWAED